jgi:branched-chain amino acid transport system substrate-binding protein
MSMKNVVKMATLAAFTLAAAGRMQDTIKIGVIAAFSGPFADYGKQMEGGIKAYMAQYGDTVAGKKIQIIVKDTTGPAPEVAKRLAQELVVRDKVDFGRLRPDAGSDGGGADREQAKKPMIVMNAASSAVTTKSDYIARFSMTLPQVSAPMATWAVKNKIKNVVTLVADYGPASMPKRPSRPNWPRAAAP